LAALHRELLDPPSDQYALADCFRASPWSAEQIRKQLLVYLVHLAVRLARLLQLEKVIFVSCDDSLCAKDPGTRYLQAVDWHHDHNASSKKRPVYRNGSVYLLCRVQIGFIQFTINWRLYLRRKTVRRLNRQRCGSQRLRYASKYTLAQQMLEELRPLLPEEFTVRAPASRADHLLYDGRCASGPTSYGTRLTPACGSRRQRGRPPAIWCAPSRGA
jgi:hypothetical protein